MAQHDRQHVAAEPAAEPSLQELADHYRAETERLQRALQDAKTKFGALVEQIPAIVYIDVADDVMTTTYVSPQIGPLLGIDPDEYIDDPGLWERLLHPDDREPAIETYIRGRESGEPFVFEYRLVGRDGRVVWFRDSAIVLPDADGRPRLIQGVMLDITERKAAEEQIAYLAYHDKLTALPNRAMFDELLGLSMARAKRNDLGVAVISVDLDDFKLVNDSLGHEVGDELILQLADRLREATRDTDLVARPGGDEFLLLLADLDLAPPLQGGTDGATSGSRIGRRPRAARAEGSLRGRRHRAVRLGESGHQRVPARMPSTRPACSRARTRRCSPASGSVPVATSSTPSRTPTR